MLTCKLYDIERPSQLQTHDTRIYIRQPKGQLITNGIDHPVLHNSKDLNNITKHRLLDKIRNALSSDTLVDAEPADLTALNYP